MDKAVPALSLLNDDQIEYVHRRSLDILEHTGIRVDSVQAQSVFRRSGAARVEDGGRIFLQPELVEWAIATAPATVEVFNRSGKPAFNLGLDRTRFGIGVTNLYYQDPLSDAVTPFTREHMRQSVRLGERLENFELVSTIGVLQDYPPEKADLYATLEMIANTTKPLVVLVSNEDLFAQTLDLAERLVGDLAAKPWLIPYFNPITPLVINPGTADKMLETIGRGLPLIFSNYSMAGMTTPITAGGTLVLMNAELLAGLTLAQLARPGTPVILGSLPAYFDMRTMQDFYDPKTFLINLGCAEMMARYRLPHAGTSGSGPGWGPDLAAAGLQWMNHITSLLGKSGLAPFVGGNLGSKAFSPALAVVANDVIGQARRLADGFDLNDQALGLEAIERVGPGGSFLDSELTMNLFRSAYYESKLSPHWSLERWQARGQPRMIDLVREQTLKLLAEASPPEDYADLIQRGEAFISGL